MPDSVTGWRVFVHGVTRDLAGGHAREGGPHASRTSWSGPTCRASSARATGPSSGSWSTTPATTDALGRRVRSRSPIPLTGENLAPAFGLPASVPAAAVHGRGRAAARRSSSRWRRRRGSAPWPSRSRPRRAPSPTASFGRSRSCRDGCTSSSRGSRRSRKGKTRELPLRRPGEDRRSRRASTNSSSSPSTPSSSTGSSRPSPTSSTIPTNARSRRSTASCRRAS